MRRLGRRAEDWIAVDSLADLWARGILSESFRWAELEQLLYSDAYVRATAGAGHPGHAAPPPAHGAP